MMDISKLLKKTWGMLWQYRALWLFGMVLALVGANSIVLPYRWHDRDEPVQWINIKVSEGTTIRLPGADMTIDFTAPGGVRFTTPDSVTWREFNDLVEELNRDTSINLWPILVVFVLIVTCSIVLSLLARYVSETAVIRMVDEAGETGRRLGVWAGLRTGFSWRAGRLFLLDLVVGVLAFLTFVVAFGLATLPILLAIGSREAVIITVGVGTVGLLILAGYLWLAVIALLSFVMQPIRRAVVLEEQGMLSAVRQGLTLIKDHLKDVSLVWLIWMAIRLLWVPVGIVILIVVAPFLLLTLLFGLLVAGVPAALVAGITDLFTSSVTAWIIGGLVGLPVFTIVTISPLLFINGLVAIYKSSLWTLAYRDLKGLKRPVQEPASSPVLESAPGTAD